MNPVDLHLVKSGPLPYLLSLPRGQVQAAHAQPLLCFLHGYGEGPPLEIRRALTRHGPLRPGNPPSAVGEFIVVAPQLPARGDLWYRSADAVREIVAQVQAQHGGDVRRTYLSGFSFGGNGVFDLALTQPDLWAALWPVDPTRVPERDPGLPIWFSSGEISRHGEAAFIRRLRLDVLAGSGCEKPGDRVYVDQGQDHVGTATLAYGDERIYTWLLSKQRPGASG